MSDLFYNCVLPRLLPLPDEDNEVPPLVEQLRALVVNATVEDALRIQSRNPHYLKTVDTVFCGAIWGVPHVLVYSPLLEGESKLSDDEWICEQMLNILQADYLKMRRKTDPTSHSVLSIATIRDAWTPPDFVLEEHMYTQWRAHYEKSIIEHHTSEAAAVRTQRKI